MDPNAEIKDESNSPEPPFLEREPTEEEFERSRNPPLRYTEFCQLRSHEKPISVVRFSPDGNLLASGSLDRCFRIWRTSTAEECAEKAIVNAHRECGLNDFNFKADSSQVVTCFDDGTARTFDLESGQRIQKLEGHCAKVITACFNPHGNAVATASFDRTTKIWDLRSGEAVRTLLGHTQVLTSAGFNYDGSQLCTSSLDGLVHLWDMASGHCIRTILGGGDETKGVPCMAARFAPDGRHVLASKLDNTVYLVDSKEAAILRRYTNHLHGRFFLTPDFSIVPSGTYIVCGSEDGRVFVWDADSEEVVFVFRDDFKSEGVVRSVSCHPSKEIIAFCEGTLVRVWYGGFEPKKEECE